MATFQTLHEKKFGGLQIVNVPILVNFSKQQQKLLVCIFLAFGTWNNILTIIDQAHTLNKHHKPFFSVTEENLGTYFYGNLQSY